MISDGNVETETIDVDYVANSNSWKQSGWSPFAAKGWLLCGVGVLNISIIAIATTYTYHINLIIMPERPAIVNPPTDRDVFISIYSILANRILHIRTST